MEYVDGRNLTEFLNEKPSRKQRERVLEQLLDVVAFLHRKGIIHNDLKPENILITNVDNDVKLLDFGLADNDAHYLSKTQGCTLKYASPELLRQEALDSRSDIYALGLLIKEIFPTATSFIVKKCAAQDRNARYSNVDQVRRALKRRHYPVYLSVVIMCLLVLYPVLCISMKSLMNSTF
jgi:serine/threonine-protein kinase